MLGSPRQNKTNNAPKILLGTLYWCLSGNSVFRMNYKEAEFILGLKRERTPLANDIVTHLRSCFIRRHNVNFLTTNLLYSVLL